MRFGFWYTPGWARYCAAYGGGLTDPNSAENVIVPLGRESEMLARMRHDHRYSIRHRTDRLEPRWELTREAFDAYHRLHTLDAGRETRPRASWDVMYELMGEGFGHLLLVDHGGEVVGASYFFAYENGSYWASSARLPTAWKGLAIGHLMVWEGMRRFAAMGKQYLDLGHLHEDSDPGGGISLFKRGFVKEGTPMSAIGSPTRESGNTVAGSTPAPSA